MNRKIFGSLAAISLFLFIGIVGSSDVGRVSPLQLIVLGGLSFVGFVVFGLLATSKQTKHSKAIEPKHNERHSEAA